MKRLQTRAAAAALSALLLASPACALAAETAPLTLNTQQDATVQASRKHLGQLEIFGRRRAYLGVSASDQWLYQARLGGLSVRLCLFTPEGSGVTFQENLCAAQTGGSGDIRLCMRAGSDQGGLLLQMDQHAVDVLRRVGVTEIVLTDMDFYVQETYLRRAALSGRRGCAYHRRQRRRRAAADRGIIPITHSPASRIDWDRAFSFALPCVFFKNGVQ